MQKHGIHVKNNATYFNSFRNHCMKSRLMDINLAIWGKQEFKHNVVPLYMAQMAYMEVALCVDMDWSTILTSSQTQR
jgi:hypothetical protein